MKRRLVSGIAALSAAALLIAGCNSGGGGADPKLKALGKDETATIKVMSNWDERNFYQQYGQLFSAKYPNIDIQVASTQGVIKYGPDTDINKEYEKFIDEHKPDVLFLSLDLYEKLAENGRLYDLEPVIKQDKFDQEGIMPVVLDTIKSRSGGKLYGLSPGFNSQALYYNKTLFEQNGISPPKDKMSWEELLELARRFPATGDDATRSYGFGMNGMDGVFRLFVMIGTTKGLSFVNPDSMTMTIKTDGWKQVAQLAIDAYKSKAVYSQTQQFRGGSMEEYYKSDPFIGGKVAMTINGNYLMDNLKQAKQRLKDQVPEWDIVTIPVDPANPEGTSSFNVSQLFAINAQSSNVRAAWEFVKYINDNEYARVTSKTAGMSGAMTSRSQYLKDPDGRNLAAFYSIKGGTDSINRSMTKLPPTFMGKLYPLAEAELKAALEGKKSIDEALQTIQEKGQEELIKAKAEDDAKKQNKT